MKTRFFSILMLISALTSEVALAETSLMSWEMTFAETLIFRGSSRGVYIVKGAKDFRNTPSLIKPVSAEECDNKGSCLKDPLSGVPVLNSISYCSLVRRSTSTSNEVMNTGRVLVGHNEVVSKTLEVSPISNLDGSQTLKKVTLKIPHVDYGSVTCVMPTEAGPEGYISEIKDILSVAAKLEFSIFTVY